MVNVRLTLLWLTKKDCKLKKLGVILMSDDFNYDDIIDKLKKQFGIDFDKFDVDFFVLPEEMLNEEGKIKDLEESDRKPFKVSYHFEPGMDKPEISYDKNLDPEKMKEFFKKLKNSKVRRLHGKGPHAHDAGEKKVRTVFDAEHMTLDFCQDDDNIKDGDSENREDLCIVEPFVEMDTFEDHTEIIIELPGIRREDILLRFGVDNRSIKITAQSDSRLYRKTIELPFRTEQPNYELRINNGIACLSLKKEATMEG